MEIARLLTSDDRDPPDLNSASDEDGGRHEIPAAPARLAPAAARRVPRGQRRQVHVQQLRAQVQAYESVLANLPLVLRGREDDDQSSSTDGSDDSADMDAQRMRSFLRRAVELAQLGEQELAKRAEWMRLLRRRRQSMASLRQLMAGVAVDDWYWMCDRWRAIASEYYEPLPEQRCYEIVQETLQAIRKFEVPRVGGISLFGWKHVHVLDSDRRYVHFHTQKTLLGCDIEALVDHTWSFYQKGTFQALNVDNRCQFFCQILQRITADLLILHLVERYPTVPTMTYSLSIAFRVKTETGYLISCRYMSSSRLQQFMELDGLSLSRNFYWNTYDIDPSDPTAVHTVIAGDIGSEDRAYGTRWCADVIFSIVRAETAVTGNTIVSLPSSG